jgi:hypothetical protein
LLSAIILTSFSSTQFHPTSPFLYYSVDCFLSWVKLWMVGRLSQNTANSTCLDYGFVQFQVQRFQFLLHLPHDRCSGIPVTPSCYLPCSSYNSSWPEPPLWSSGQSSWLQIHRSGFDSQHYQIFWEVVGLERGPLNLVSTVEELLGRKSSGSGLESWEFGSRDPSRWPRGTLYPQKLALTSPTSSSVSIVRSQTQASEFSFSRWPVNLDIEWNALCSIVTAFAGGGGVQNGLWL